jgi:hypothetical protein
MSAVARFTLEEYDRLVEFGRQRAVARIDRALSRCGSGEKP